jgi:hypothetical protein
MAKIKIKNFATKRESDLWLVENQARMKAERRCEPKFTSGQNFGSITAVSFAVNKKGERLKAIVDTMDDEDEDGDIDSGVLNVKVVINATNILDSHRDLHIPGIWKKSLSEKKLIYLCQEHDLSFKGIISDEIKAYTQVFTFKELGVDLEGSCECLVFDAVVREDRNDFMFNQYKKGYVRNHSVRMEYVKEYFCMNSEEPECTQFKENWDKYAPLCANKEDLAKVNWFYAVTEAKIRDEGSAVVKGSCFATPTMDMTIEHKVQADNSLENPEPPISTQKEKKKIFIN